MNLSLALLAASDASIHGLLELLLYVILAILILGVLWIVTTRLSAAFGLPDWIPLVILAVVVIIVLLWLVDGTA